jgi:hypothetical protein
VELWIGFLCMPSWRELALFPPAFCLRYVKIYDLVARTNTHTHTHTLHSHTYTHLHSTEGTIVIVHILIRMFLDTRRKDATVNI